jgi:hypothetical protein
LVSIWLLLAYFTYINQYFLNNSNVEKIQFLNTDIMIIKKLLLILFIVVMSTACFKDIKNDIDRIGQLVWNPTLGIPISSGTYTFTDFQEELSSGNVSVIADNDGLLTMVYQNDSLFSKTAEDLIDIIIDPYSASVFIDLPTLEDLPINGTATYSEAFNFSVDTPNNDVLDSVLLKSGVLNLDLSLDFPASGDVTITFESMTNGGTTLVSKFDWTYDPAIPIQQFNDPINLQDIFMDLTKGGTTSNNFDFRIDLTLIYEGQPVSATNKLDIDINILDPAFKAIYGTMAQRQLTSKTGEFEMNLPDKVDFGDYFFDDPSVIISVDNSFGAPLDFFINDISGQTSNGRVQLQGPIVNTPIPIGYPPLNEIGEVISTDISIDSNNSNLPELLAAQPTTLEYDFTGILNSSANTDAHFIMDTSRLSMTVNFELPLVGRLQNLTFSDNYDFDATILEDAENALFRLTSINGFPLDADIQIYFFDENQNFLDSLIYEDTRLVKSGVVDTTGKVVEDTESIVDVALDKNRLIGIAGTTNIRMRATLNTPTNPNPSVRIFEDDQITLKLFVQTEFALTF